MAKTITRLPQPPTTAEPQNFDDRADAFVGALPAFVTEANELAAEVEESLQTVQTLKENADASKQSAQTSAQTASEAKEAAARSASEAESSAQAAEQIKTQTQEIKQSAQESLAVIAAAAQSSAQAARQSEQAAEQTKTELQTATNTLEQMKSIVKDGFIDDAVQSETKTYSSKKIAELNEALSADVAQKLDQTGKEIRTAAMSGAMPSAYESDLAMWDYMEILPVVANEQQLPTGQNNYALLSTLLFEGDINLWTYNHSVIPIAFEGSDEILPFRKGDAVAIYNIEKTITLIDGGKAYVYCQKDSNVYIFSAAKGMKDFSKNSQIPNVDPLQSFESKYLIYLDDLKKEAHVYVVDAAAETLKYAFKKKIDDDKFSAYGSAYVAFNYLKIGDFTFKITDTDLTLASEGEIYLPKQLGGEIKAPFHRSSPNGFIISGEYVYDVKSGKVLKSFMNLKFSGFLGRTDYLLIKNLSDEYYSLSYIYDVKYGVRCVRMPEGYYPVNVSLKDGYAYVLFVRADSRNPRFYIQSIIMVIKIPMKFLTGKNYKG
jgi:hypothetical protein cfetvA_16920